jgi:hypothetical protein
MSVIYHIVIIFTAFFALERLKSSRITAIIEFQSSGHSRFERLIFFTDQPLKLLELRNDHFHLTCKLIICI